MQNPELKVTQTNSLRWYPYVAISLCIHAVLLLLGYYWIPDLREKAKDAVETVRIELPQATIVDDAPGTEEEQAPIEADANPFEDSEEPELARPNIVLARPQPAEMPETEVIQPDPHADTPTKVVAATEAVETIDAPNAVNGVDTSADASGAGQADLTAVQSTTALHHGGSGAENDEKTGHAPTPPRVDETALWAAYKKQLNAHFKARRHYPEMARQMKLTGTVIVMVEIDRSGQVLSAELEQSSGIEILDEAALSSAKKASPVPAFPEGTTALTQKVLIPYKYQLN